MESPTEHKVSLKDLVDQCNSVPVNLDQWIDSLNNTNTTKYGYHYLSVDNVRVGLLDPNVSSALLEYPNYFNRVSATEIKVQVPSVDCIKTKRAIRSQWVAEVLTQWRQSCKYPALLGWRDELYPVYGRDGQIVFDIERAGSGLFGVRTYGCHLTAYTMTPELRLWIARRSLTKPTFPGMYDNTVAGGLPIHQTPMECILRECLEEANLPHDYIRNRIKAAGNVSYYQLQSHLPTLGGFAGPETQFVFDLLLDDNGNNQVIPTVNDNEVLDFGLFNLGQALHLLRSNQFKPNCALVLIDFLIRHGYITAENEPDYLELVEGCHRALQVYFPGPKWSHNYS